MNNLVRSGRSFLGVWTVLVFFFGTFLTLPSVEAQTVSSVNIGPASSSSYDMAAVTSVSGRLDTFGVSESGTLQHWWGPANGTADNFEDLGGVATSEPSAVSWGAGHVATFVRGGDGALWYLQWDNGSATGWQSLGGSITYNPQAISLAPGHIIVFARGKNTQAGIWYREFNAGVWGAWQTLGGWITNSPTVVSWGAGHIMVLFRGNDGKMWYTQRVNSTWTSQATNNSYVQGDVSAVSRGVGSIDVFHRGNEYGIWHVRFNGSSWSGSRLGTTTTNSEPGAVATMDGKLQVFIRQPVSNGVQYCYWRFNNSLLAPNGLFYDSVTNQYSATGWFETCVYSVTGAIYNNVSIDGGYTWAGWANSAPAANVGNPEVATNVYGGWNLAIHGWQHRSN